MSKARHRLGRLRATLYGSVMGNVAARLGSLASLLLASLLVARADGPAAVGVYALMHVLPGLVGTILSAGLAVAAAYFLAGPDRDDPRLRPTLMAIAAAGGCAGAVLWAAAAPLIGPPLFPRLPVGLVAIAGLAVLTRLIVTSAKSCSQGSGDMRGSNFVIFAEEFMFLPVYLLLVAAGAGGYVSVVAGLVISDVLTGSLAWSRLLRRGFLAGSSRPSPALARRVAAFGMRGQVGGLMSQLNLRLDFVVLTVLAGPAVVGVYAIGSKFAELVKVVGMALTYVLYPEFARDGRAKAAARTRRLLPKAGLATAALALPLWLGAGVLIPGFYGADFADAVTPARIILAGLVFEGIGSVVTAFLYGAGRPGLNSIAMACGLSATLALDIALIPPFGATGAAIASAAAYTATTLALVWFFVRANRPQSRRRAQLAAVSE